ncbi:hypothetical protein P885DRAFT_43250 [Corynascus similis CBS 632.67]
MLLAKYLERAEEESIEEPLSNYRCTCDHTNCSSRPNSLSDRPETASPYHVSTRIPDTGPRASRQDTEPTYMLSPHRAETFPNADDADNGLGIYQVDSHTSTGSNIRGVTGALVRMVTALERVSPERFDDEAAFKRGKVTGFPEIPGEQFRHERLPQIKRQWGEPSVDPEDCLAAPGGRRSRANSFSGSISRSSSIGSRAHSPQPPARRSTTGAGPLMLGLPTTHSPETTSESIFPSRPSAELEHPKSQGTVVTLHEGPNSPAIVLSVDDDSNDTPESPTAPPIIEPIPPIHRSDGLWPDKGPAIPAVEGSAQRETQKVSRLVATRSLPTERRPPSTYIEQLGPEGVPNVQTDQVSEKKTASQMPQSAATGSSHNEQRPASRSSNHLEVAQTEVPSVRTGNATQQRTAPQQQVPRSGEHQPTEETPRSPPKAAQDN